MIVPKIKLFQRQWVTGNPLARDYGHTETNEEFEDRVNAFLFLARRNGVECQEIQVIFSGAQDEYGTDTILVHLYTTSDETWSRTLDPKPKEPGSSPSDDLTAVNPDEETGF